jgi:hypothetical protein
MKCLFFAIALFWLPTTVLSDGFGTLQTGNDVYGRIQQCKEFKSGSRAKDDYDSCLFLLGYATGVQHASTILNSYFDSLGEPMMFCWPDGTTTGQWLDITYNYLVAHPEELHEASVRIFFSAAKQAWPCLE